MTSTDQVEALLTAARSWGQRDSNIIAIGLAGSWARGDARSDSDIDLIVLAEVPGRLLGDESWYANFGSHVRLVRSSTFGVLTERRLLVASGAEVEVCVGPPSWAATSPLDDGTCRVVDEGLRIVYDPLGLLSDAVESARSASSTRTGQAHVLCQLFNGMANGRFPEPDSLVVVLSSPPGPVDAVVAFTAHHVVAADVEPSWVQAQLPEGDLSAPMSPRFLGALAERLGTRPGSLDVVFCATGEPGEPELPLVEVPPSFDHPRVDRAQRYRRSVRVYADEEDRGVLIIGRGLANRMEAAVEVKPCHRGHGLGRLFARSCLRLVEPGTPLFMQAAPGNAASLRAIIAAGFVPVAGEVLFARHRSPVN